MPIRGTARQWLYMWWVILVDEARMVLNPRRRQVRAQLDEMLRGSRLIGPRDDEH